MKIEVLSREVCHEGFFTLERYRLRHGLFAGGMSPVLTRELFCRGLAAAALLYDPEMDRVVLIEQFRVGAMARGDGAWLLECVAGMVEAGESPEEVVRREAMEEAGCHVSALIPLYTYYPAPGGSSEQIALYVARVDASRAGGIHGLDHEGEDIRVHTASVDEALDRVLTGEIDSSYTIMALQWLALHRADLVARWQPLEKGVGQ